MFMIRKPLLALLAVAAVSVGIGGLRFPDIKEALPVFPDGPEISEQAETHILHGDKSGGGHLYGTGKPCKTEFPEDWNSDDILGTVRKVAANDNLPWKQQKNGYHVATQKIEDIRVRVVLDKDKDSVITAYPLNGKTNACKTRPAKKTRSVKKNPEKQPDMVKVDEQRLQTGKTYNFNRQN